MIQGQILVGGGWREACGGPTIAVVNPSDGRAFAELARGTAADVDAAVRAARAALGGDWGRLPALERGRILIRLGQLIEAEAEAEALGALEAQDTGKPLRQARADALALARQLGFYGGAADKIHGHTIAAHAGTTVLTLRAPRGVTGHIVASSDPMPVLARSLGAALAIGNACVLKPGEAASLSALEFGRLALAAGLPAGALNIVTGYGSEAGEALTHHPGVDHVAFTGSRAVGRLVRQAVAAHGGTATLELGGKSAQLVFADADFDQALPVIVNAAIHNAGQTCGAASLLLVEDRVYDGFIGEVAERFHTLDVGAAACDLDCGPLISQRQLARAQGALGQAHRDRVLLLAEGKIAPNTPEGGFYVKPTLLGDVPPEHALAREEIAAPMLLAIRFADEDEAIRIANGTSSSLMAGVWTRDGGRQLHLAHALEAGHVFVNSYGDGLDLPGGSGCGSERGLEALYGFSSVKTVAIRHG